MVRVTESRPGQPPDLFWPGSASSIPVEQMSVCRGSFRYSLMAMQTTGRERLLGLGMQGRDG